MTKITKKETAVIINLAYNEMNSENYGRPSNSEETITYSWAINEVGGYPGLIENHRGTGGVVSSLVKKGLAWSEGTSGDASTGLTDEGYKLFNEMFPTTQDVDNYYEAETGVAQEVEEKEMTREEKIEEMVEGLVAMAENTQEVAMNRAEAHNFFNRGPLFKGVGKTEHLFQAMLTSCQRGRRMSLKGIMNRYNWTERRAKDVIRYNASASNMSVAFDGDWVVITWK